MQPKELNQKKLVRLFKDCYASESTRFCFLLGAGASVSSGIPTASTLAKEWFEDIKTDQSEQEHDQWIKDKNIDIDNLAASYTHIYGKRFYGGPSAGFEKVQKLMESADPSIGYLILAKILEETRHSFVITTNFDYLVEDSLYLTSKKRPLVCGHEALANFICAQSHRPTIIKVHRDLMLDPFNDNENTKKLKVAWVDTLKPIVKDFHLIVLGYGGNDGSLMGYLKDIPSSDRQPIYWCCRNPENLNTETNNLLSEKDYIVSITGFDELMYDFNSVGNFQDFIEKLKDDSESPLIKNAKDKTALYRRKLDILTKQAEQDIKEGNEPEESLQKLLPDWWVDFQQKINAEKNIDKQEKLYQEGIEALPNSSSLIGNYAVFLKDIRKDYDAAEKHYKKALESEPDDADFNGNYANFLKNDIRKDYDAAEKHYKKALESEPDHANINGNYASFLLAQGRKNEGKTYLDKAFTLYDNQNELLVELWFYVMAHFSEEAKQAKKEIITLLNNGVTSPGWDFSANIERAKTDGCDYVAELEDLAEKITVID